MHGSRPPTLPPAGRSASKRRVNEPWKPTFDSNPRLLGRYCAARLSRWRRGSNADRIALNAAIDVCAPFVARRCRCLRESHEIRTQAHRPGLGERPRRAAAHAHGPVSVLSPGRQPGWKVPPALGGYQLALRVGRRWPRSAIGTIQAVPWRGSPLDRYPNRSI